MVRVFGNVAFAVALLSAPILAQTPVSAPAGVEGDLEIRDCRFADASTLPLLRIHYTTLGRPRKDASGLAE